MLDQNLSIIFGTYWTWKTYYAVRNAYEAYKNGAIVITNMWLAFPHVRFYLPEDLPNLLHEIYDYHEKYIIPYEAPESFLMAHELSSSDVVPRSFYILIDEASVFFNAREFWKNFKDASLRVMMTEPRHFNMQITAIAQDLALIDKMFRDLAQEIIEFTPFYYFWRRAYSYDKKYLTDDGWNWEIPIVEQKTYFHWLNRKRDDSQFFWGLYFTKEVLGDYALRLSKKFAIQTLKEYLEKEDSLVDWRDKYHKKIFDDSINSVQSAGSFARKILTPTYQKKAPENEHSE